MISSEKPIYAKTASVHFKVRQNDDADNYMRIGIAANKVIDKLHDDLVECMRHAVNDSGLPIMEVMVHMDYAVTFYDYNGDKIDLKV